MKEEFLQFIWQTSLFKNNALKTFDGKPIQVIKPGTLNKDSGPDFFNSRLMIDNMIWSGNVEVHITSSEWMQHGHQFDAAYNNVVLHVVYEHDQEIVNQLGKSIPTLELRSIIPPGVIARYNHLYQNQHWIACEQMIGEVDKEKLAPFIYKLFVERLEDKTRFIMQDLKQNQHHWEKTFYEYLARNFGFKTNSLPFHVMAKSLPMQIIAKHRSNLLQLEALLFGQAGMLNGNFEESYPNQLKKEYQYLKKAYQLEPIHQELWKFATMRPANFPTIRIAEFAQLVHQANGLFSKCMEIRSMDEMERLFNLSLNEYWQHHYQFDQVVVKKEKRLGRCSIENIFMNTIAPFMFAYGKEKLEYNLCDRSIQIMESIPAEVNGISKNWINLGFEMNNALKSQAFIQLKNMYCTPKKCLSCSIGNQILQQ
jgi:hypothetical protein